MHPHHYQKNHLKNQIHLNQFPLPHQQHPPLLGRLSPSLFHRKYICFHCSWEGQDSFPKIMSLSPEPPKIVNQCYLDFLSPFIHIFSCPLPVSCLVWDIANDDRCLVINRTQEYICFHLKSVFFILIFLSCFCSYLLQLG